jgi:hypothetical protein
MSKREYQRSVDEVNRELDRRQAKLNAQDRASRQTEKQKKEESKGRSANR